MLQQARTAEDLIGKEGITAGLVVAQVLITVTRHGLEYVLLK
jgi:hypothetical protein